MPVSRPRAPRMVMNYMSKEDKLRFDECNSPASIPFTGLPGNTLVK